MRVCGELEVWELVDCAYQVSGSNPSLCYYRSAVVAAFIGRE